MAEVSRGEFAGAIEVLLLADVFPRIDIVGEFGPFSGGTAKETLKGTTAILLLERGGVEVGVLLGEEVVEALLLARFDLGEAVDLAHAGLVIVLLLFAKTLGAAGVELVIDVGFVDGRATETLLQGLDGVGEEVPYELAIGIFAMLGIR